VTDPLGLKKTYRRRSSEWTRGAKHRLRDDAVSPAIAPTGIDGSRGGGLRLGDGGGGEGGEE
jgi:hypothetical protein